MEPFGVLTKEIDAALVVLYAFWLFFAGLVFYLLREGRREGYPLVDDITGKQEKGGIIWIPDPKKFELENGEVHYAPDWNEVEPPVENAVPAAPFPGSPLMPTGNPLTSRLGAAAWAHRVDRPDLTAEGEEKILPMRLLTEHEVAEDDADPRGFEVIGADGQPAGIVEDMWIDRPEMIVRYLEVRLMPDAVSADGPVASVGAAPASTGDGETEADAAGDTAVMEAPAATAQTVDTVLVPMNSLSLAPMYGQVTTPTILAHQFPDVPRLKNRDQITLLEEEKIQAYFAGGELYAKPERSEPLF